MKINKEGRGLPSSSRLPSSSSSRVPSASSTPSLNEYQAFHGMLCRPKTAQRCIESFAKGVGLFTDQETYDRYNNNSDYHHLGNYDFNRTAFPLTVWTYYALVICSLTGLCSLLRITNYLKAVEYEHYDDHNTDKKKNPLLFRKGENKSIESTELKKNPVRLPPTAIDYVIDRSIALGPLLDTTTTATITTTISEHIPPPPKEEEEEDEKKQTQNQPQAPNSTSTANSHSMQLVRWFEYEFGYGGLSVMMLHFHCPHGRLHLVEVYQSDTSTVFGFLGNLLMTPLQYLKSVAAATATATQQPQQRDRSCSEEDTKKKET
eukprot:CAMPEP_0170801190 /NCGR_PEP_ID=MMETSP0733-20121128/28372_1 /TAXON_ID=186038 /ORGANISM="Fragilariopsis kerguelensis, Strain L26-C5" /LENGTH=318 /DNA_ID=CAMNT_0011153823 /DNA_START=173 /DNA_END=1129 /DNA_ORIENTATION=+